MKKKLAALQEEIEAVNRERKMIQEGHASRLHALSRKWLEVMQKNVQIEVRTDCVWCRACVLTCLSLCGPHACSCVC